MEVRVAALLMDPVNRSPVVVLREDSGTRILPIWIGEAEAWAIAMEMQGIKRERPMTHDLLKQAIDSLKGRVSRILVTALVANTFYARIVIEQDGTVVSLDARPSDSIALALRSKAPIFVSNSARPGRDHAVRGGALFPAQGAHARGPAQPDQGDEPGGFREVQDLTHENEEGCAGPTRAKVAESPDGHRGFPLPRPPGDGVCHDVRPVQGGGL